MRCEICNTFTPGGVILGTCDKCKEIINEAAYKQDEPVEYSVIPSQVDYCGRVIKGEYIE